MGPTGLSVRASCWERKSISSKGNSINSRHKGWEDRESIKSQEDRDELHPGMGARVEPER